ncbi:PREDICTED: proton pump-interactor 1-like [Camelina sativa]|uniref:Proton pump-interactor 1-like n=1 Tax=Camelina sativa TaxID=90675 RepID=A0ABM0UYD8_CAMSA|nr:PREDICTED: proton pump-interactor 1-like [Camelina sativa]XP_010448123.1 PREDICTED: proton pump-interactor 1-like [Camelina sativa]
MGVEVVNGGFEVAPAPFEGKPDQVKGDNKVSIKFGSHGEPPKKAEETNNNKVLNADVPKDAAEEWPAARQIHSFYFIKYHSFKDPKMKAKLDAADKDLEKWNKARGVVLNDLRAKRTERSKLFDLLDPLKSERKGFNSMFDEKRKEMEPLQQALGKLKNNDGGSARGPAICSSEEELNTMIYSYQYRIQHESIPLTEEKQLLKEIRLLEGTRDKVIANAAMRAKIKESMGQKDDIQGQVKLMGAGLDGVKKERQAISARINELGEKLKATKDEIQVLENELKNVSEKRDKAYSNIHELRKQRDETNSGYYQNRTVLNKARDLAAQKNITELEALSNAEVEKFISLWCSKKNFREDYEKRSLASLDFRQLSRDGRMRNPEEKPLIAPEVPPSKATPSEAEVVPKAKAKPQPKEEPVSAPKPDASVPEKTEKAKDAVKVKNVVNDDDEEEVYGLGKPQKEEKAVDAATAKEMRKQEEIAKAKQAMERKKKLAEKAAAKAAIRAQKEAEKKEKKEQEKKAKKKTGGNTETEAEEVPEASEAEKEETEALVQEEKPQKEKVLKEKPIRNRIRSRGGPETLPRAILKRKKSTNYWVYAAPAALAVLMLLVLGYYYVL